MNRLIKYLNFCFIPACLQNSFAVILMNYPAASCEVSNRPPNPQSLSPGGGKGSRDIPGVSCPLRGKDVRRTTRGLPLSEGNHLYPAVIHSIKSAVTFFPVFVPRCHHRPVFLSPDAYMPYHFTKSIFEHRSAFILGYFKKTAPPN